MMPSTLIPYRGPRRSVDHNRAHRHRSPRTPGGLAWGWVFILAVLPTVASAGSPEPEFSLDWSYVHDAGSDIDRIWDVAVDPGRGVLVCGDIARRIAYVMKLDEFTGEVIWSTRLGSTIVDTAVALVVDAEGASYVAGSTTPNPPFPDIFLAKVDADGNLVWSYSYDEFDNNDEAVDVALGPDDSVVVTGHANGLQGGNFFTAKLTRAGELLWTRQIDGGEGSQRDSAVAVAVDNEGGVLVTGTSEGPATDYVSDVLTAKYSPAGDLLWTRRFAGPDVLHDYPRDLAAAGDGGAVVVGTTDNESSSADPLVLRYGPDGSLHWLYDRGTNGGDSARAVVLDSAGNIYVAGSTFTSQGGFDVLALKLDPDGRRAWQLRWDGGEGRGDAGQAIALDETLGHVLVAATSYLWMTETDVTSLVLDAERGSVVTSAFYNGAASRTDAPLAIAADPGRGFVVGGFSNSPFEDFLVLRYASLLAPEQIVGVDLLRSGQYLTGGLYRDQEIFVSAVVFVAGQEVVVQCHVVDGNGTPVAGAVVEFVIDGPAIRASVNSTPSSSAGLAEARWKTSSGNERNTGPTPPGSYEARVVDVTSDGRFWDGVPASATFGIR